MEGRCDCPLSDCECTDESHRNEQETPKEDNNCYNHWVRVAYAKSKKAVSWASWRDMVEKVMEDTMEYFWHHATFAEYTAAWEEEMQEIERNDNATPDDRDRSLQLSEYLERMKKLIKAGFNPQHSYDEQEGLWMWA